jgi:MFS family permease
MPIAGMLADKIPVGRTVPFAMALIAIGFFSFTQVGPDTSYVLLCGSLFVMGLGMGGTMMPIMTSALRTLTHQEVARGSTLVNILQQIGGSIGGAVMSVVLTSKQADAPTLPGPPNPQTGKPWTIAEVAQASHLPEVRDQILKGFGPDVVHRGLQFLADSFAATYWVGFALVLATFIPIAFLPRKREVSHLADGAEAAAPAPVVMH